MSERPGSLGECWVTISSQAQEITRLQTELTLARQERDEAKAEIVRTHQEIDNLIVDKTAKHRAQCERERARAIGDLKDVVQLCSARFREYEQLHAAKGSVDGDVKARSNASMAELCENTLALLDGEKS